MTTYPLIPPPFIITDISRSKRSIKNDLIPFLENIIYNYTNPLECEQEPHTITSFPLVREHLDSYLYYIYHKKYVIPSDIPSFQIIFNPVPNINTNVFRRTITPQNIHSDIEEVFNTFLNNLIDFNNSLETPIYLPSAIEHLSTLTNFFEVPDIERKIKYHDNPHHWLERDICQIKNFTYHFFKNITLNAQTVSQIRVYSLFLRKFFRFNYELLWSERDQAAFNAFPNFFTEQECLPFLIKEQNKHKYYVNPTHIPNLFLDLLQFDPMCITENPN